MVSASVIMAPQLTPCTCMASVLAVFLRRVAQIDLVPAIRHTSNARSLSAARRNLSTFSRLRSRGTTRHDTVSTTTYARADLEALIPFDQAHSRRKIDSSNPGRWPSRSSTADNHDPEIWAINDLEKKHAVSVRESLPPNVTFRDRRTSSNSDTSEPTEVTKQHEADAAFLELNPETIDVLAAKSLEDDILTTSNVARPKLEARPNSPTASMKGFRLRHSSPLTTQTPKGREFGNRDSISLQSQVPGSGNAVHRRYSVPERQPWQIQKAALKEKFKEGWNPRKKLSPDALAGIRAIHAQFPEQYTTTVLAQKFEVSPEAIRRILKSRWNPKEEEALDRQRRWFLRGQKVWSRYAELGSKPPARWRKLGIGRKESVAASRRERKSVDTKITTRSADYATRETDENFSSTAASMAERIL